jgi:hypothetical protein
LGVAIALAIAGGIAVVALLLGSGYLVNWACRSRAERIAMRQFKQDHPNELFVFSQRVRHCRDVVMITYGTMAPANRKYYRVSIASETATEILDEAKYQPKDLR